MLVEYALPLTCERGSRQLLRNYGVGLTLHYYPSIIFSIFSLFSDIFILLCGPRPGLPYFGKRTAFVALAKTFASLFAAEPFAAPASSFFWPRCRAKKNTTLAETARRPSEDAARAVQFPCQNGAGRNHSEVGPRKGQPGLFVYPTNMSNVRHGQAKIANNLRAPPNAQQCVQGAASVFVGTRFAKGCNPKPIRRACRLLAKKKKGNNRQTPGFLVDCVYPRVPRSP